MSTIATWRTTPLTEKQSKRLDLGLETLNNTTDKVQKEIYSLLKTSLLDGRMKRKSKTLLSEHLQGVNGNPYGFIGFIHKLFDQTKMLKKT